MVNIPGYCALIISLSNIGTENSTKYSQSNLSSGDDFLQDKMYLLNL